MTDIINAAPSSTSGAAGGATRPPALSALRLPELQALAGNLGVAGTSKMRKSDLVTAIQERHDGASSSARSAALETRRTSEALI